MRDGLILMPYAFDLNDYLVHIKDASKANEYSCPNCRSRVVPRKGEQRRWHYSHKANPKAIDDVQCGLESYLHHVGKVLVAQLFSDSIKSGQPILAKLQSPIAYEVAPGRFESGGYSIEELTTIDLSGGHHEVFLEKFVGDFRPDVLVCGGSQPLFVEICVTSRVSETKKKSQPILELQLETLDDLETLLRPPFVESAKVRFFGFDTRRATFRVKLDSHLYSAANQIAEAFLGPVALMHQFVTVVEKIHYLNHTLQASIRRLEKIDLREYYTNAKVCVENQTPYVVAHSRKHGTLLKIFDRASVSLANPKEKHLIVDLQELAQAVRGSEPVDISSFNLKDQVPERRETLTVRQGSTNALCHGFRPANHWQSSRFKMTLDELVYATDAGRIQIVRIEDLDTNST